MKIDETETSQKLLPVLFVTMCADQEDTVLAVIIVTAGFIMGE